MVFLTIPTPKQMPLKMENTDFQNNLSPKKVVTHIPIFKLQGVPKKIGILSSFEFLDLGGFFSGVKNNSKNFGNKINIGLYSKIFSKWAYFYQKNAENLPASRSSLIGPEGCFHLTTLGWRSKKGRGGSGGVIWYKIRLRYKKSISSQFKHFFLCCKNKTEKNII